MIRRIVIFYLLTLVFTSCDDSDLSPFVPQGPPVKLQRPDCKVMSVENRHFSRYDSSFVYSSFNHFQYEGNFMVRTHFDPLSSTDSAGVWYHFDEDGYPDYSFRKNDSLFQRNIIAEFEYSNGKLKAYIIPGGPASDRSEWNFEYENGHLSRIFSTWNFGSSNSEVRTDRFGNPVSFTGTRTDDVYPNSVESYRYQYTIGLNPFYGHPPSLYDIISFFQQNVVEVYSYASGPEFYTQARHEYEYHENKLPVKRTSYYADEFVVTTYTYDCVR